jgi:hypothetical protein
MNATTPSEFRAGTFDRWHDVDLKDGRFTNNYSLDDLKAAFKKFEDDGGGAHLCVFFHGGLVDYNSGLDAATTLLPVYSAGGTYPFFFIWHSGLWQALADLLLPHLNHPAFVRGANRAFDKVASKIEAALGDPALTRRAGAQRKTLRGRTRTLKDLAALGEIYDRAWQKRTDVQLSCSSPELDRFADFLVKVGKRGEGTAFRVANLRGPRNAFFRIIWRLNTHHDHGVYTTIIEELLIALGVGGAANAVWDEMKSYIDDSFKPEADAGGSAFLDQLALAWRKNPNLRLTLIGHSAGSIYVQRFIEELHARFPESPSWKVEVLHMAPALSMARMSSGLEAFRLRVGAFRMFTLTDKAETGYCEVPGYQGSLLYIVSGLCEADPASDKPLLGMQRYWSGNPPYKVADILAVTRLADPSRVAWCPTDDGASGWQCGATQHGGFPLDPEMEDSSKYLLKNGFQP